MPESLSTNRIVSKKPALAKVMLAVAVACCVGAGWLGLARMAKNDVIRHVPGLDETTVRYRGTHLSATHILYFSFSLEHSELATAHWYLYPFAGGSGRGAIIVEK